MRFNHYKFKVVWSEEDQEWVATVEEMESLSVLHKDPVQALKGLTEIIEDFEGEHDLGGES